MKASNTKIREQVANPKNVQIIFFKAHICVSVERANTLLEWEWAMFSQAFPLL